MRVYTVKFSDGPNWYANKSYTVKANTNRGAVMAAIDHVASGTGGAFEQENGAILDESGTVIADPDRSNYEYHEHKVTAKAIPVKSKFYSTEIVTMK